MTAAPSMADAPFHCPPDIVLDLPMPISVNRIWRSHKAGKGHVSISPEYQKWKKDADNLLMELGQLRGVKTIIGSFEVAVTVKRCRGDLDNRLKGILDYLQSRTFIVDDKFCERITMEWGDAPHGCRVTVKPRPIANVSQVLQRAKERA
jgi:Holliday junction resolvase RusA-like endonuclease